MQHVQLSLSPASCLPNMSNTKRLPGNDSGLQLSLLPRSAGRAVALSVDSSPLRSEAERKCQPHLVNGHNKMMGEFEILAMYPGEVQMILITVILDLIYVVYFMYIF